MGDLTDMGGRMPARVEREKLGNSQSMKGSMKKLFLGLSLIALLAGCASHENENGMGGTSDQYQNSGSPKSSDQYNNNATQGTGTSTATNNTTGQGISQ
jgi:hypothetical protein